YSEQCGLPPGSPRRATFLSHSSPSAAVSDRRLGHQLHALEHVMILESIITCPHCRTTKAESMPTDACRFLYECSGCGATLRPKPGDCWCSVPMAPFRVRRFKPDI